MANPETPTTRITIGGYEAAILVDSKEVEHYKIEVDYQTKSATCWIASEEGKHFAILLRKAHKLFDCVCKLKLDGHRINGHLIYKREVSPHIKSSVSVDQSTARRFVFAALKVTDNESSLQDAESVKNIGEIEIVFHRVSNFTAAQPLKQVSVHLPEQRDVHERAKRAAPHRIQFMPAENKSTTSYDCDYHEVTARFVIRYTSLDMLKALGIAPRAPSPPPPERSPPPSDTLKKRKRKAATVKAEAISDEELSAEELAERREEELLRARLEDLERKRAARTQGKPAKKVKIETKPVAVPYDGEVIDLT